MIRMYMPDPRLSHAGALLTLLARCQSQSQSELVSVIAGRFTRTVCCLAVCERECLCVLRIMDWPGPIGSVTPRMLLKRLRDRHNEIREQLEHGCEELKEVSQLDNSISIKLSISNWKRISIQFTYVYSTFNAIPNWPSHRSV